MSATVAITVNQMKRLVRTVPSTVYSPVAVNEQFDLGDSVETLVLPAGNYLKVAVTGLSIDIGGQRLTADLSVERLAVLDSEGYLTAAPSFITKIRFANVSMRFGTPNVTSSS